MKTINQEKDFLKEKNLKKLQKDVKMLGAKSLDYSNGKNSKYFVTLETGRKAHFGSIKYDD